MNQILDRLWCGDYDDGRGVAATDMQAGYGPVTYILNISQYPYDSPVVPAVHYPIQDEVFLPANTWAKLTHLLSDILAARYTVLVHCRLGKSRAPSLCAAYLMRCGFAPDVALRMVQQVRPLAFPHPKTWESVLAWALPSTKDNV